VSIATVNEHLKNIFKTNELKEDAVIRKFLITASDGKNYNTQHYNLDAIISLGYRINSNKEYFKDLILEIRDIRERVKETFISKLPIFMHVP